VKALRASTVLATLAAALVVTGSAAAHAHVSPSTALANADQVFTVSVPTEKEGVTTTGVELIPPSGFEIDAFFAAPGWKRDVQTTGSGENTEITRVAWTGGAVPHDDAAIFQFVGSAESAEAYSFKVRQTYSDGTVVDWAGPESSDSPAPVVELKSSLGGGGSDTLAIAALVLAVVALIVAALGLLLRGGRRPLT
jgi:uncharacterized protein YcnI